MGLRLIGHESSKCPLVLVGTLLQYMYRHAIKYGMPYTPGYITNNSYRVDKVTHRYICCYQRVVIIRQLKTQQWHSPRNLLIRQPFIKAEALK